MSVGFAASAADALFLVGLIAYLAGALAGLAGWRRPATARVAAFTMALAGALIELVASGMAIVRGAATTWTLPFGMALFPWTIRLDPLSAYFNFALAFLALAVSVFSFGYLRHWEGKRNIGALAFFYNVLLLSLTLVFTAANAFFFLVAWEVMALSAFCLVTFEHEKEAPRRAGVLFLIMSHAGTGLLLAAFMVLASSSGSLDFASFHLLASQLPPLQQGVVFVLFFLGFGVKAGIVPLHIWLPDAHPVAPSNISALMSGIVIKTGIYGMARVFFDFYGAPPLWAGTLVLTIGVVTALLGVLYALMEHDLKRLLAYHSIENIGIILIGFGAALLFRALDHPQLAALALIAGLYHTLNHATFKGLLFLGAGSVLHSTGTRNMEEMGGLIRRMPATAMFFLIGAVAISGLPPLNGFVSEWLTYQALLAGFGTTGSLTRMMFPIAGSLLALTAALAAACFVKAFGIPFLALPRSEAAANAQEAPFSMRAGMGILAAGCVIFGLGAPWILPLFDAITDQALGVRVSSTLIAGNGFAIAAGTARGGTVSTLGIAMAGILLAGVAALLIRSRARLTQRVTGPTWDCGLPGLTADNQYTATAFTKPLRMIFSALYRPRREIQAEYEVSPYYPTAIRFESGIEPTFEKHFYDPLKGWILGIATRMRGIQAGSIHAYLAYIFVTLILLLLFGVRGMIAAGLNAIVQLLLLLAIAPLVSGLIKTLKARMQTRRGPGILQPYRDLDKLLRKGMVIPDTASWIFTATPYVLFVTTAMAGLMIPMTSIQAPLALFGGVLAIVYLLGLGRFFLALGGLDTGSSFGGLGSSREMTISALAEPAMMLAVFTVAIGANSTSLSEVARTAIGQNWHFLAPAQMLACAALFIVLIAETGRIPVDNPATHLELTMVHEAMILEYSGPHLALIEWSAAIKQLVLMTLLINVFWPFGLGAGDSALGAFAGLGWLLVKLAILSCSIVLVETTNAKMRLFRVPELLAVAFTLGTLALVSTFLF